MLRRMDLRSTPEQEVLRDAFRAWLEEHLPWPYGVGLPPRFADLAETAAFGRRWQAARPGGARGPARLPELVGRRGINLVGPTLLAHGTDEQKARFLPRILSAQELWCQLFSEPDAGSDLASLSTRAVPVEGGYRVAR